MVKPEHIGVCVHVCVTTGLAEAPALPPALLTEDNLVLTADAACPLLCPY